MPDLRQLGYEIRKAREGKDISQEELGERLGVSRSTVGLLERGLLKYPRMDHLTTIAGLLGISPVSLYALAGISLPESGSAQIQWLAEQLTDDRVDLLVEIGHTMLREQGRQQAKASPRSGTRKR